MKTKTIEYVDWTDLRKEICKEMGIEEKKFRDTLGTGRDHWHVWIDLQDGMIHNGCVVPTWFSKEEISLKGVYKKYGDWIEPFLDALEIIFSKYKHNSIYVKYYW